MKLKRTDLLKTTKDLIKLKLKLNEDTHSKIKPLHIFQKKIRKISHNKIQQKKCH